MSPLCEECGGPFPVHARGTLGYNLLYSELTLESDSEVLGATCEQIGLPPLSLVTGAAADSSQAHFKLAGELAELFKLGDAYDR